MYHYKKPNVTNCKVTFVDDSVFWQKMTFNDKFLSIKVETNKLYFNETCTKLVNVTRKQKIKYVRRQG